MIDKDDFYDEELPAQENIARGLFAIARAIDGLVYGMKYSSREGLSIAEAIEVAGTKAASEIGEAIRQTSDRS